jgi:non-specific serine/threonine protein kinase
MSVIDELYENRNAEELTIQLEEKYSRIKEFDTIRSDPPARKPGAHSSPYQVPAFSGLIT